MSRTNNYLLIIFIIEALLKILCMETNYFRDNYNNFDVFTISLTLISKLLTTLNIIDLGNLATILRVFRLGRILRLINKAKSLRMIFNTFVISLSSLISIGLLLFLIQFIFTILGVELFAYVKL